MGTARVVPLNGYRYPSNSLLLRDWQYMGGVQQVQTSLQASFSSRTYNFNTLLGRSSFPDFTAKKVVVPPFQRDYSWEKSHVATFWDDVTGFFKQLSRGGFTDTYFLGPIVILPEQEQINLLDGQQRLATATILLSVIRDIARARGGQRGADLARDIQRDLIFVDDEEEVFALRLSELDAPFFQSHIQEDPPSEAERARLRSHRLIRQAKLFLTSAVTQEIEGQDSTQLVRTLKRLKDALAERIKLVTIQVGSEEEAYLIFETLNDRGLRLSVPDLLLNHLMRRAGSAAERQNVRNSWDTVVENLGLLRVSTFLRHMWVSRYGDVKSQGLYREIRTNLTDQNIESLSFARLCATESKQYSDILGMDDQSLGAEASKYVRALVRSLSADRAYPLLLSGLVSLTPEDFAKLARNTVSLVVRHSILANLNPADLEDTLYSAARVVRTEKDGSRTSHQCLQAARSVLSRINPTDEQLRTGLEEVFLTKKQAGYIVYALAEQLQSPPGTVEIARNSIEHIFPEGAEEAEWPNRDELEPFVWHIGNLTVLEPGLNRQAGNRKYDDKKGFLSRSDILMTRNVATNYPAWGREEIVQRSKRLLPVVKEVWRVSQ